MRKTYKIGEVANILGVSADTIRYYEKAGIVYSKKDSSNGYRSVSYTHLTLPTT